MKKIIVAAVLAGLLLVPQVYAQPAGGAGTPPDQATPGKGVMGQQGMMTGEEGQQMMPMCLSMMRGMMGHGMMMQDVLQAMKDMLVIQEKMIKGVKPAEKPALLEQLLRLQGKVDQMMSQSKQMMHGMPAGMPPEGAPATTPPHH